LSGEKGLKRRELFERFLATKDHSFYVELAESIAFDRGEWEIDPSEVALSASDFMSAPGIANRGRYVKNKGWFSLHGALRALIENWTIIGLALGSMKAIFFGWSTNPLTCPSQK